MVRKEAREGCGIPDEKTNVFRVSSGPVKGLPDSEYEYEVIRVDAPSSFDATTDVAVKDQNLLEVSFSFLLIVKIDTAGYSF